MTIRINGRSFNVTAERITGAELRALVGLAAEDALVDLYLEKPGVSEDVLVSAGDVMTPDEGARFFTVPREILMGQGLCSYR